MLVHMNGELEVEPGRDFVCLTPDPTPNAEDFALIEGQVGDFDNRLLFICELIEGIVVPGSEVVASFNGEPIFSGTEIFDYTTLCPETALDDVS